MIENLILAAWIERYTSRRYHRGAMHVTQVELLRDMTIQLRGGELVDQFVPMLEEAIAEGPGTAVAYFGTLFLDFIMPDD